MEKNNQKPQAKDTADKKVNSPRPKGGKKPGGFKKGFKKNDKPRDDFEQKIVDLARVTRVMAGGKRMKFRACMVVGDKKGQVGVGIAKGIDVSMAISKAVAKARKNLITVPIINGTVPHEIYIKKNSAKLLVKPAKKGNGIKAGGVMRIVLELAGIKDVVGKILGSNNKVNNAKAVISALDSFVPKAVERAQKDNEKKKERAAVKVIKMKSKIQKEGDKKKSEDKEKVNDDKKKSNKK